MYVKKVEFTDYNGQKREEEFYFNLSKAEIYEMQLGKKGGFDAYLRRIMAAQDVPSLAKEFKELLLKSYGEKSEDGRRFIKSPELTKAFMETEAYSIIFTELITDAQAAAEFANKVANVADYSPETAAEITKLPSTLG